jgi:hypothetical protein
VALKSLAFNGEEGYFKTYSLNQLHNLQYSRIFDVIDLLYIWL